MVRDISNQKGIENFTEEINEAEFVRHSAGADVTFVNILALTHAVDLGTTGRGITMRLESCGQPHLKIQTLNLHWELSAFDDGDLGSLPSPTRHANNIWHSSCVYVGCFFHAN